MRAPLRGVGRFIVVVLALRTAYLTTLWLNGAAGVERFHVESACLTFVVVGLVFKILEGRTEGPVSGIKRGQWWSAAVWVGLAALLYWPAFAIGFLSDDFYLVSRARGWTLAAVGPQLFRPLPLAIWGSILSVGGGAVALHGLNVLLHGTNSYLVAMIAVSYGFTRLEAWLAGLLMLTIPVAVEAVAWCSGVFDLLATTLICSAVLVARTYEKSPSIVTRSGLVVLSVAGVLTKETAVVLPVLVVLSTFPNRRMSRALAIDLCIALSCVAVFAGIRLFGPGTEITKQPITKYLLQRWAFRSFGGLAVPWHSEIVGLYPLLAVATTLISLATITRFFIARRPRAQRVRTIVAGAVWVLIALIPVATFLYIAPDLQGSRYLYLPAVGWVTLLVAAGEYDATETHRLRALGLTMVVVLPILFAVGVRLHLRYWTAAAWLRDRVERSAAVNAAMRACSAVAITALPDTEHGAYVFRNGVAEAFKNDVGLIIDQSVRSPSCSFRWDGQGFVADSGN